MPATHVLVPVKALGLAKSRLAHVLDPAARESLVIAMLQDTVAAALAAGDVEVTVVTADERVAAAARSCGAAVLPDPIAPGSPDPLNAALRAAAHRIRERVPAAELVALQADLPSMRAEEFAHAREVARRTGSAVVTDHTSSGTTALLHCVAGSLPPLSFGPGSARRHIDAGAYPVPDALPGLRLDVDTPDDLAAALQLGVGPATATVLDGSGFHRTRDSAAGSRRSATMNR
ncbi:2-phospho-L-lactate guanylyltransferase [Rhodococcus sp. NPDC047139]|uniref:2-phospho-L-lactate guanylyltransferase n=1 Tax=Rhodococcus sp. NPDC047139 TaxID=3155141 RepID=UPI00340DFC70